MCLQMCRTLGYELKTVSHPWQRAYKCAAPLATSSKVCRTVRTLWAYKQCCGSASLWCESEYCFYFDADPDPTGTFHTNADPNPNFHNDPDPTTHFFQIRSLQWSKMTLKGFHIFNLMRIWIHLSILMWIRVHPSQNDTDLCRSGSATLLINVSYLGLWDQLINVPSLGYELKYLYLMSF